MLTSSVRLVIAALTASLFLLSACNTSTPMDQNTFARQWLDSNGKQSSKIVKIVAGNPKSYKADALYCVQTDQSNPDGQFYLVTLTRTGDKWQGMEMVNGNYEWQLNGCPD